MEKLTLSITDKNKIDWIKDFARSHDTNVSRLFDKYVETLMAFEQVDIKISNNLQSLRQPGKRPTQSQIKRHLTQRRKRSSAKKQNKEAPVFGCQYPVVFSFLRRRKEPAKSHRFSV